MIHEWTNGGDSVLVLRVINMDGTSGPKNNFMNSTEVGAIIKCPDWDETRVCGNGLHGWPWGVGRKDKYHHENKIWQVVKADPKKGVHIGGKAKWPEFEVVYSGNQIDAMKLLIDGQRNFFKTYGNNCLQEYKYAPSAISTHYRQIVSSATYSGTVFTDSDRSASISSGDSCSSICVGEQSCATTIGWYSTSNTAENHSAAICIETQSKAYTQGYASISTTLGSHSISENEGESSVAVCVRPYGIAKTGKYGCIVLGYMEDGALKFRLGKTRDQGGRLKPNTYYKLNYKNQFEEVKP